MQCKLMDENQRIDGLFLRNERTDGVLCLAWNANWASLPTVEANFPMSPHRGRHRVHEINSYIDVFHAGLTA